MNDAVIEELSARGIDERIDELIALLADAIRGGASVGFVDPLAPGELEAFWREMALDVEDGVRNVWVALDGGHVVGSVQLAPSGKANQRHRADVQKLLVLSPRRGRGIGAALMRTVEERALALGRYQALFLCEFDGPKPRSVYVAVLQ